MKWRIPLALCLLFVTAAYLLFQHKNDGINALAVLVFVLAAMLAQLREELLKEDLPPPVQPQDDKERRQQTYERAQKLSHLERTNQYLEQRSKRGHPDEH